MATNSFSFTSQQISTARFSSPARFNLHRPYVVSADSRRNPQSALRVAPSSLYEVLGVQRGATSQEIKSAYRKLAKVLHPDTAGDCDTSGEFILLHSAYATLSDPEKREMYDVSIFRLRCVVATAGSEGQRRRRSSWETDQCW